MNRLALLALFPSVALAQAAAPAAPSPLQSFLAQYVYPALLTLLGTALTALVGFAASWMRAHAKGTAFEGVVTQATEVARSAVAHVDATLRPKLLAAMAPDSDGGVAITDKEKAELKAEATRLFYTQLAPDVLARLRSFFGAGLDTFVSGLLERALDVHQATQAAGETPAVASPPTP